MAIPERQIRALFDDHAIRVYQAYRNDIADTALAAGTFVSPPFSMTRMTWVKPSFLWMMYRSGWGRKDAGQSRILAVDISRAGFEWALEHSCPSHPASPMSKAEWAALKAASPVRIQWDPERDLRLDPLPYRAIQVGLSGEAVRRYVNEWIVRITDVTDLAAAIHSCVENKDMDGALERLPKERPYPS